MTAAEKQALIRRVAASIGDLTAESIACRTCGRDLPLACFYLNHGKPTADCRECTKAARKVYYADNRPVVVARVAGYRERTKAERPAGTALSAPLGKKICRSCRRVKPVNAFAPEPRNADGLYSWCRECKNAATRLYIARPEVAERRRLGARQWYRANIERVATYNHAYRQENSWRIRYLQAVRHRRVRQNGGTCTPDQLMDRWAYYGDLCWVCGCEATETDHVIPVSRGGPGWPANLRPICGPCNRLKSNKPPLEFLRGTPIGGGGR